MHCLCFISELVIRFTYVVRTDALILSSITDVDLTLVEITSALTGIAVTGLTGQFYVDLLYSGDISLLVSKEDLCFLVVEQKVSTAHYVAFETAIASAWKTVDSG